MFQFKENLASNCRSVDNCYIVLDIGKPVEFHTGMTNQVNKLGGCNLIGDTVFYRFPKSNMFN